MKCKFCDFEIEKPNQRTCPCCGHSLDEEPVIQQSPMTAPTDDSSQLSINPSSTIVCPQCQAQLPEGTNFCPNCGFNFRQTAQVSTPPHPEPPVILTPEPPVESTPEPESIYTPQPESVSVPEPEPVYVPEPESEPVYVPEPKPEPVYEPELELEPEPEPEPTVVPPSRPEPRRRSHTNNRHRKNGPEPMHPQSDEETIPENNGYDTAIIEDGPEPAPAPSSPSSWLIMATAAIGSLLVGAALCWFL